MMKKSYFRQLKESNLIDDASETKDVLLKMIGLYIHCTRLQNGNTVMKELCDEFRWHQTSVKVKGVGDMGLDIGVIVKDLV